MAKQRRNDNIWKYTKTYIYTLVHEVLQSGSTYQISLKGCNFPANYDPSGTTRSVLNDPDGIFVAITGQSGRSTSHSTNYQSRRRG